MGLLQGEREARANGRFPGAGQIVVEPGAPSHLAIRSTFGMLDSRDGGKTVRWICEEAAFFAPTSYDPAVAMGRGGVVLAGLASGLSRGTVGGCSWEKIAGRLDGLHVVDVSFDAEGRGLAVASAPSGRGRFGASSDGGATWEVTDLPEDFDPLTVDAAPGRPARVYVSARVPFPQFGGLLRSDDGGVTWSSTTFDLRRGREAYLSGVDPGNPDRLWIRLRGDEADRLLLSSDAGLTWSDVLATSAPLYGFALSPDGLRVAASSPTDGLLVASTTDHAFTKLSDLDSRCLAWSPEGLYACASEPKDPLTLGLFRGGSAPIEPRYRLLDTEPLDCPPATRTGALCPALWPSIARQLGKGGAPPGSGSPDSALPPAPPPGAPHPEGRIGGGGCGVAGERGEGLLLAALIAATALIAARRAGPPNSQR